MPKATGTTFFSSATPSPTNSSNIFILVAQPVFQGNQFNGVVAASIPLTTLGRFLRQSLSPNFRSSVGILDSNGTVLYSGQESLIGQNVFGNTFQSVLPSDLKQTFNPFLHESLAGNCRSRRYLLQGEYLESRLRASLCKCRLWSGLTIWRFVHNRTRYVDCQRGCFDNQQRLVSTAIIVGIGAMFFGTAFMILRWNRTRRCGK